MLEIYHSGPEHSIMLPSAILYFTQRCRAMLKGAERRPRPHHRPGVKAYAWTVGEGGSLPDSNNNNNERISRAPFHVKRVQLR